MQDLLWQYLRRTVYDGGRYEDVAIGISLGCPLSPLMGALFLDGLDQRMAASGLFYARFMDDWVILAPTHWALRRAIGIVNQMLAALTVSQHPDKTFIGRILRGFDFLGYQIHPDRLCASPRTAANHAQRIGRLYEQGASATCIGQYVQRWQRWLTSGLGP
ncbi:MAG: hypothetical protein GXY83_37610 [Rhodopirellula sp.]|nr:hypothetical protein [Rhodopirellula sp.]